MVDPQARRQVFLVGTEDPPTAARTNGRAEPLRTNKSCTAFATPAAVRWQVAIQISIAQRVIPVCALAGLAVVLPGAQLVMRRITQIRAGKMPRVCAN
jgi:hypothetical protein